MTTIHTRACESASNYGGRKCHVWVSKCRQRQVAWTATFSARQTHCLPPFECHCPPPFGARATGVLRHPSGRIAAFRSCSADAAKALLKSLPEMPTQTLAVTAVTEYKGITTLGEAKVVPEEKVSPPNPSRPARHLAPTRSTPRMAEVLRACGIATNGLVRRATPPRPPTQPT